MDVRQSCGPFRFFDRGTAGHANELGGSRTHRDELNESAAEGSSESRMGRESFVGALCNFFHRPPKALLRANGAAATPPPPDGSAAIRSGDTHLPHWTQSRPDGTQSPDGGTIFFEGADDLAAELQSAGLPDPQNSDWECEEGPRVVLWMRAGDPTLRTTTIRGVATDKSTEPVSEQIKTADEVEIALQEGFHVSRGNPERRRLSAVAARPLMVWTVWTNPLCG